MAESLLTHLTTTVIGADYPQIDGSAAIGPFPDPFPYEHLYLSIAYLHYHVKLLHIIHLHHFTEKLVDDNARLSKT